MKRIYIEALVHDEHPSYADPVNGPTLLAMLSAFVVATEFQWRFDTSTFALPAPPTSGTSV